MRSNDYQSNCYQWLNGHKKNTHQDQMIIRTTVSIQDQINIETIVIKD